MLGGNASAEAGVSVNGAGTHQRNARESGIIEEAGRLYARLEGGWSAAFDRLTAEETNLTVFLNRHVSVAVMSDSNTLAGVRSIDTLTHAVHEYRGRLFIDCTGDGWLGYHAGAIFRFGRESREEFGEDLAPPAADRITMSGCIMGGRAVSFRAEERDAPMTYTPPPWAPKFSPDPEFGRTIRRVETGEWWIEHPGAIDDLWDAEAARDELIRISFGYWDLVKNAWSGRARAAKHALTWVPLYDAKRETRRLVGDHILTQQDVQTARLFADRIAHGGWNIDVHHPGGIFSGREGPFDCDPRVPLYSIPFRCLYSTNIVNLLMAGRHVSMTHVALGTVRVQGTLAALGQAAGTAAALCLRHGTHPRGLYERHLGELQQTLLRHDQYIPGLANADPADLARRARLSASSTARSTAVRLPSPSRMDLHPLNMPRALMFARGNLTELATVSLVFASSNAGPAEVTARLRRPGGRMDPRAEPDVRLQDRSAAPHPDGIRPLGAHLRRGTGHRARAEPVGIRSGATDAPMGRACLRRPRPRWDGLSDLRHGHEHAAPPGGGGDAVREGL